MSERFFIYGRESCPFCIYAIDFCKAKKIEYYFIDCSKLEGFADECKAFYGQNTVPIILSNDLFSGKTIKIGGYTDLLEYFDEGN